MMMAQKAVIEVEVEGNLQSCWLWNLSFGLNSLMIKMTIKVIV